MGSLKDEMRGLREDRAPFEKMAEDGELPGGSDGSTVPVPEAPHMDTSEDITPGDYQPQLHTNAVYIEDSDKDPPSKDEVPSGGAADNADRSDSTEVKDSKQTDAIPPTEQPTTATHDDDTTTSTEFLRGGGGGGEVQEKAIAGHDDGVKQAEIVNISVPVPSTPGPFSPLSPAPIGQHHMRTQVSLEVVQCCSAATSPMTPPQGGQAFTFPSSSLGQCGASLGSDTKDAGLQVGLRTECCSVATSPMTPKTPSATAFPELVGGEIFLVTKSPAVVASDKSGALKCTASSISTESCPSVGLNVSPVTLEDSRPNQQGKQQRMGSMDQDITILVTLHGNSEEEEEKAESSPCPTGPEMVQIECDEIKTNTRDAKKKDGKEMIFTQTVAPANAQETSGTTPQTNTSDESSISADKDDTGEDLRDISVTKPPSIPQSPAPFGCHNMRTQVSLEVVHCQSVATSPMTPPQGDQAFCFPSSSLGQCGATETKDAQMQAGEQVEFRSVATAPMTPRTPTATTFPEVREEASRGEREEKISEEEGKKKVQLVEDKEEVVEEKEENVSGEKESEAAGEDREEGGSAGEKGEEEEEPLQEVSWDEKGMTWEVYGAVVEVTVLGSAIQKHLEKQVEKQKKPSMPPPPPLSLLATPPASEGGSSSDKGSGQGKGLGLGKGRAGRRGEQNEEASRRRRNPFRLLMENMQQPHCCSRAHSAE